MAAFSTVVGLTLSAVGTGMGIAQQSNQKKATQEQAASQLRMADIERRKAAIVNARQTRDAIRQARIARAQIINSGAGAGTSDSSGVLGGAGSVVSQGYANQEFHAALTGANERSLTESGVQAQLSADMGSYQGTAAIAGALGKVGGTIFDAGGGWGTIKTIFNTPKAA